jgi:alpha-beta hydrolase superfamily lysophospholipase
VLFSPGFGVPSSNYALLLDDLASHGYVVLAIDHPYEAPLVFPGGRLVPPTLGDNGRDNTRTPPVRLRDARFVLDHLAALDRHGALAGRLDLTRIAMIGHSQGGATAASLMLADHRVAAGADIDGSLRGRVERVALDRPFLLVRADRGPRNDWFLHTIEFRKRQRGPLVTATFADVQHMGFSDYLALVPRLEPQVPGIRKLVPIGRADPVRTLAAERGIVRAFLDTYLRDRPATLPGLGYPGVRITARAGS